MTLSMFVISGSPKKAPIQGAARKRPPVVKSPPMMFAVMIGISIYVIATYPRDFGSSLWSSPKAWADNPKTVAPKWTALWDKNAVVNQSANLTEPSGSVEHEARAAFGVEEGHRRHLRPAAVGGPPV